MGWRVCRGIAGVLQHAIEWRPEPPRDFRSGLALPDLVHARTPCQHRNAALDAQAAYDFGRPYTIEGSAVNLADRHTYDPYEYFGFAVVMPNQPISAYVTLKIHLNKE